MNKIFKVIFSKAKGCYVVVSELAKSAGKGTSASHIQRGYSLTLAAAVLSMMMGMAPVGAVELGGGAAIAYDNTKGNLTIGDAQTVAEGANKNGKNNTTIGTQTDTLRNVTEGNTKKEGQPLDDDSNTVLVDGEGKAHNLNLSTEAGGSTAVGYQNKAEGDDSTAIGNNAKITNKPVTYYVDADGKKTASSENAVWYKDSSGNPTKVPQVFRDANGNTTTTPQYKYTHTVTAEDGTTSTVTDITSDISKANKDSNNNPEYSYQKSDNTDYLYSVTLYQAVSNSIAAGTNVTANGNNAVVVGYNSTADNSAVAVGDTATASGDNTIAIGTKSKATDTSGTGSIAIGKSVEASGGSTAVGLNGTNASGSSSAYGNNATASNGASAFGKDTHASNGGTAVGNSTTAYDSDSSAFGSGTHASSGSTAVGNSTTASGNSSAFGYGTNASGTSTAVGHSATADSGSVALGDGVRAGSSSGNAVAIGRNGTSADGTAVAVGDNVHASYSSFASGLNGTNATNGGIAYGDNVSAKESGVAVGRNGTKASGNDSTAIGSNVSASSGSFAAGSGETSADSSSIAIGMKYNDSYKTSAFGYGMALGFGNTASGSAVAIGHKTSAYGGSYALGSNTDASNNSIAIGIGTSTWDDSQKTKASGGSVAIGENTHASDSAYAVGSYAYANGGSYAFGSSAHAENNSYAIGDSAYARSNSMAIGSLAKSNVDGGIALGSNSTVYRGATAGLDPRNGQPSENTTPTWKSTYGALSIGAVDSDGNVTGTRQIIGVAAGTNDTDAVNLAQLKQVAQGFSIHDYGVNSVDTTTDTNYNNAGAQGNNSLAAGVSAKATGTNAVAIGYGARAEGKSATAIGKNASATGQYAMAFGGFDTTDKKGNPVTMTNTASGASATAFGQGAQAKGNASLAFGHNTVAGVDGGNGQQSVAFGEDTQALGGRSLAFGEKTVAKYNDSVAFGNDTRASSTGATAFGNRTRALSSYSTAWGNATVAADEESTAWGTDTIAGAKLDENGAVTNNYKINPDDKNEPVKQEQMDVHGNLAYVRDGKTAGIKQMKIDSGSELHDYVVLAGKDGNTYVRDYQGSLWKVNVAADGTVTVDTTAGTKGKVYNGQKKTSLAKTTVDGSEVDINPDNVLTKAHEGTNGYTIDGYANATAFGYSTEASGDNATAFGNDTKAKASAATAFGTTTTALGDNATAFGLSTTASGKQTTAFGSSTTASGDNATAFGENSTASGEAATAFGIGSTASGKNSLAGLGGTASAENAAAIGNSAQATLADSVALGSNSKTTRAKYIDLTVEKEKAAYAKYGSTGSAWEATANAIAVGNDSTTTRQITGVAAGSLDTDAVNVAQLRAVDAKHTIVTVGGQPATADNIPVNGGNLDLKRTTATNGQETYDLSLDKNVTLGKQVENEGGKLTVNNVDKFKNSDKNGDSLPDTTVKEAVKIDGKTVSVVKHDGSDIDNDQRQVVLGVDQDAGGYVTLYDNTGRKPTYIYNAISDGITYLKDKDSYLTPDPTNPNDERASNEFNRLEYGDYRTSTIQFIATLDDGQKYAGDNYQAAEIKTKTVDGKTTTTVTKEEQNVLLKKLNERLDIKGGANKDKLTENNIGVNVDSTTGVMKVQLAQNLDLTDKGSVKMGNTTVSNGGVTITPTGVTENTQKISLTDNGLSNGGKQITHVDSGLKDAAGNPVDLATASGDVLNNAVNVGDLQKVQNVASAHTAVTVNGGVGAPGAGADGNWGSYTDKEKGNLLLAQKKDTTTGQITYDLKLNDNVILGKDGSDGKDGQEGTIGLTGKNGLPGADGKQGYSTTIIKTEKGQAGKDGKTGKENLGGTDITRIVYTDKDGGNPQTVATMDDGLKFAGDDVNATVSKKLNSTLQIRGDGTYDETTKQSNGNIQTSVKDGTIKVALNDKINLHQDGSLTVGGDTQDGSTDSKDPIVIKHFDDKTLDVIGVDKDGKPTTSKEGKAGDYVTGLDNKDWDVSNPTYVSGRAATEDQLKKVSDAVNSAAATAGKHTVVTVNDKDSNETNAEAGTGVFGNYAGADKGNLLIAAKDDNGQMTYNIKLNDQLAIGQKGEPGVAGKDGKDGKVTVETKGGTTVVIGHDGEPGKDGKDGLFVTGKDGADGVSITGPNGADGTDGKVGISGTDGKDAVSISGHNGEGHIGLTGPKGADGTPGKDGISIDITTDLKTATLDDGKNVKTVIKDKDGKDTTITQAPRIQYDSNGKSYEVATMDDGQKYAGDFGKGASVKLNKTVTIKGNVAAGKTKDDFVDGNIAVVVNKSQNGEDGELLIKLNKDLTGLNSATYTTSTKNGDVTTTVVDGTGLKIDNGPSITNTGIDGGKHQITNVASGKEGKMYDTTVKGQENWNNAANIGDVTNIAKSAADGVQAKSGKNITVDDNNKVNLNDHITLGDAANKAKQVDIDGNGAKITAGDGDNKVTVDGSKGQIVAGGDNGVKIGNITEGDSRLTIYDKDGKATNQTDKAGKYVTNLDNKTWKDGGSYVSGRAATEDQLHQVESNVNKQIADVNTKIDKVDKHHTEVTVNGGTPAKADGSYTDGNLQLKQTAGKDGQKVYDLKLNDQLKVGQKGDAGKAGKDGNVTVETKGGTTVVIGHDGKDGKDGRDGLFVTGKDGKDGKSGVSITGPNGVAGRDGVDGKVGIAGKDGRDAVSIAGRDGVGHIGLTGPKGADGKDGAFTDLSTTLGQATLDPAKNVKGKDGDTKDEKASRIHYETTVATKDGEKTVSHEVATMDDGMKYGDDFGNTAKVKLNHQLDIVGDINAGKKNGDKKATKDDLSYGNIGIVATDTVYNDDGTVKENGKMTVKLAKDLKGLNSIESNSVTTGNTTINNGGLTIKTGDANRNITVQDGNVNMGGNQIHHVAPGQAPDDAVNVSQLNATNYAVNKLDTRVNRVGANAAALAALHPLDFDPDDKWDFSAGYGHYKDANAAAVGAFYRPNEDTMFSVGGSFGGGENMVNAGVSVKLGQGNHVSTSRVAMAKEIKDLKKDVAALKAVVNQQSALIDKLTGVNAGELSGSDDLFPDVPANHWAYEYVTRLKQAGILTGYPDGNFAGDRMMTRYEFAAIVYRAIMAGAAANPSLNKDGTLDRLAREFSSEMKYIRIDTIRKDRNGRPTIQRVRVIKEDEKEK